MKYSHENRSYLVHKNNMYYLPKEAYKRIYSLIDTDSFEELDKNIQSFDFLEFTDTKTYSQRLREAKAKTKQNEAFISGKGKIGGYDIFIGSLDFRFLGGSLGSVMGEKITRLCERAQSENIPLILIVASGGARMQEGLTSLMQMAKISVAVNLLKQNNIPYINILTNPTTGGVTASFGMQGDITISEPNARIGFAGPRVIEQTIRAELPPDFQMSQTVLKHGMLDIVVEAPKIREIVYNILCIFKYKSNKTLLAYQEEIFPEKIVSMSQDYKVVRNTYRPRTQDYIGILIDNFIELHGDRCFGDDASIIGGIGYFQNIPIMVIGHEKGKTNEEMKQRNFGMTQPEGFRKAKRLMILAEKFHLPIITFMDTAGAYPGVDSEERGQSEAVASCLLTMAQLKVPIVTVNIGEGGSGGGLALGLSNKVAMLRSSIYNVISPEGCAAILFRDAQYAEKAAKAMKITAQDCFDLGIIDAIVEDGLEKKSLDLNYAAYNIKKFIYQSFKELLPLTGEELVQDRYKKFRNIGKYK